MDGEVLAAFITSALAFIISIANIVITLRDRKTTLIVQNIASNRIKWIEDMRSLMQSFAVAYIEGEKEELKIIKAKMDVYMRFDDESYSDLYAQLNACMSDPYMEKNYEALMKACQNVLHRVWRRMKIETGMSNEDDLEIREKVFSKKCTVE